MTPASICHIYPKYLMLIKNILCLFYNNISDLLKIFYFPSLLKDIRGKTVKLYVLYTSFHVSYKMAHHSFTLFIP